MIQPHLFNGMGRLFHMRRQRLFLDYAFAGMGQGCSFQTKRGPRRFTSPIVNVVTELLAGRVANCVFRTADGVLHFSRNFVGCAFRLQLGASPVALPYRLLDCALGLRSRTSIRSLSMCPSLMLEFSQHWNGWRAPKFHDVPRQPSFRLPGGTTRCRSNSYQMNSGTKFQHLGFLPTTFSETLCSRSKASSSGQTRIAPPVMPGLRYVSDKETPGITRLLRGQGFSYRGLDGATRRQIDREANSGDRNTASLDIGLDFAGSLILISPRPGGMRRDANNIGTIRNFYRSGIRRSLAISLSLPRLFRKSARRCTTTWRCAVCRVKR